MSVFCCLLNVAFMFVLMFVLIILVVPSWFSLGLSALLLLTRLSLDIITTLTYHEASLLNPKPLYPKP